MKNKSKMRKAMKGLYMAKAVVDSESKCLQLPPLARRYFSMSESHRLKIISLIHPDCFRWDKPQIDKRRYKRIHGLSRCTAVISQCVPYSNDLSKRIEKLRTAAANYGISIE